MDSRLPGNRVAVVAELVRPDPTGARGQLRMQRGDRSRVGGGTLRTIGKASADTGRSLPSRRSLTDTGVPVNLAIGACQAKMSTSARLTACLLASAGPVRRSCSDPGRNDPIGALTLSIRRRFRGQPLRRYQLENNDSCSLRLSPSGIGTLREKTTSLPSLCCQTPYSCGCIRGRHWKSRRVTPRKPVDPDAITLVEATSLPGRPAS